MVTMERNELVAKMRQRVDQCRRLARDTTDERTAKILNQIADEGEADITRLLTENAEGGVDGRWPRRVNNLLA